MQIMQKKSVEDVGLQPKPDSVAIHSAWTENSKTYCLGMDAKVYCWNRRFAVWVLDTYPQSEQDQSPTRASTGA